MIRMSSTDELMFSDLLQKTIDAEFDDTFPENGSFVSQTRRGKEYWYYRGFETNPMGGDGKQYLKYVGPKGVLETDKRVEAFSRVRSGYRERRNIATKLRQSGLPAPITLEGRVIQALSKAGLFRLRCVLVGSVAFQTYAGLLGVKLPGMSMRTDDVDFAQYFGISQHIDDRTDDIEMALKSVDSSFTSIMYPGERSPAASFRNQFGFKVDILTPNRGSRDYESSLAKMPALGNNVGAFVLRFLDYLIHEPVTSLLLHDAGVAVTVPAPERFAVHKLLVSTDRPTTQVGKIAKDRRQASDLIQAFDMTGRLHDIGLAWIDACDRGPSWRERLRVAALRLEPSTRSQLSRAVMEACKLERLNPLKYLFDIDDGKGGSDETLSVSPFRP